MSKRVSKKKNSVKKNLKGAKSLLKSAAWWCGASLLLIGGGHSLWRTFWGKNNIPVIPSHVHPQKTPGESSRGDHHSLYGIVRGRPESSSWITSLPSQEAPEFTLKACHGSWKKPQKKNACTAPAATNTATEMLTKKSPSHQEVREPKNERGAQGEEKEEAGTNRKAGPNARAQLPLLTAPKTPPGAQSTIDPSHQSLKKHGVSLASLGSSRNNSNTISNIKRPLQSTIPHAMGGVDRINGINGLNDLGATQDGKYREKPQQLATKSPAYTLSLGPFPSINALQAAKNKLAQLAIKNNLGILAECTGQQGKKTKKFRLVWRFTSKDQKNAALLRLKKWLPQLPWGMTLS